MGNFSIEFSIFAWYSWRVRLHITTTTYDIVFGGKEGTREDFCRQISMIVMSILIPKLDPYRKICALMLSDMCVNIWDHAYGYGEIHFRREGTLFCFEIKDTSREVREDTPSKPLILEKGNGSKHATPIDHTAIQRYAERINMTIVIDTTNGFHYKGEADIFKPSV